MFDNWAILATFVSFDIYCFLVNQFLFALKFEKWVVLANLHYHGQSIFESFEV